MKLMKAPWLVLLLLCCVPVAVANAASKSDRAKEKRWESQIVDSLMVGEAVKLAADGVEFLGLYAESHTDSSKGGVIIMHGIGVHPAWPDVVEPLRMNLPDLGWHTLSIQMPVLENEAEGKDYIPLLDEAPARVAAAVKFLQDRDIAPVMLVAHSLGASMAAYYLSQQPQPDVKAAILIGLGSLSDDDDSKFNSLNMLKHINVPVMDLYGANDLENVIKTAAKRKQVMAGVPKKKFLQKKVDGANHFFLGKESVLIKIVDNWLSEQAGE